jgi:hypothetical protein
MNTKVAPSFLLVVFLLSLLPCLSFAGTERKEEIVALVTRVDAPQPGRADTVTLTMIIHRPSRFGGFEFLVATESTNRAKIRADFPVGSLQILELPGKTMKELEDQVDPHLSAEKTLDTGMDPARLSQFYILPSVKITDLPRRPVAYSVNTERAEQDGGGQPATRTKSK